MSHSRSSTGEDIASLKTWVEGHQLCWAIMESRMTPFYELIWTESKHLLLSENFLDPEVGTESNGQVEEPTWLALCGSSDERTCMYRKVNKDMLIQALKLLHGDIPYPGQLRVRAPLSHRLGMLKPLELQLHVLECLPIWIADELVRLNHSYLARRWLKTLGKRLAKFFEDLSSRQNLRYIGSGGNQSCRSMYFRSTTFDKHPTLKMKPTAYSWEPRSQHPFYGPPSLASAELYIVTTVEVLAGAILQNDSMSDIEEAIKLACCSKEEFASIPDIFEDRVTEKCIDCIYDMFRHNKVPMLVPISDDMGDFDALFDENASEAGPETQGDLDENLQEILESQEFRRTRSYLVLLPDEFLEVVQNMKVFGRPASYAGYPLSKSVRTRYPNMVAYFVASIDAAFRVEEEGEIRRVCPHDHGPSMLVEFWEMVERTMSPAETVLVASTAELSITLVLGDATDSSTP